MLYIKTAKQTQHNLIKMDKFLDLLTESRDVLLAVTDHVFILSPCRRSMFQPKEMKKNQRPPLHELNNLSSFFYIHNAKSFSVSEDAAFKAIEMPKFSTAAPRFDLRQPESVQSQVHRVVSSEAHFNGTPALREIKNLTQISNWKSPSRGLYSKNTAF